MRTDSANGKRVERIKQVRAQAIEHSRRVREVHEERRSLMKRLIAVGWSQADIARELRVTRESIQKMMTP